jgi:hypothetical protein
VICTVKPSAVAVGVPNVGVNAADSGVDGTVVVVDGTVVVVADGTVVVVDGTVVVVADGTVVVVDGTIVVVADGTVVVVDGTIVVVDGTIVVVGDAHGSMNEGAKAKPPRNTKGAATTDSRPAEVRTQRATMTPATNKNTPAIKTNVDPPVSGKLHTSTANTTTPAQ